MRMAYADLPRSPTAVARLIERLKRFDGWALATSADALRGVLPLCPPTVRVAAWLKLQQANPRRGIHQAWEPVIVQPARSLRPGVADALAASSSRGDGADKPIAFAAWVCGLVGMVAGDTLEDMGTGAVGRAWQEISRPLPKRRRRRRPPEAQTALPEGGQKHSPVDPPEPRADPGPTPPVLVADEIN